MVNYAGFTAPQRLQPTHRLPGQPPPRPEGRISRYANPNSALKLVNAIIISDLPIPIPIPILGRTYGHPNRISVNLLPKPVPFTSIGATPF